MKKLLQSLLVLFLALPLAVLADSTELTWCGHSAFNLVQLRANIVNIICAEDSTHDP